MNIAKAFLVFFLVSMPTCNMFLSFASAGTNLWPGVEGLNAGVIGYRTEDTATNPGFYYTDSQFPQTGTTKYRWTQYQTVDPFNCLVEKSMDFGWRGINSVVLFAERQQPSRDELSSGRLVQYWVPNDDGTSTKVSGYVVPWVFTIQLVLKPGSGVYQDWVDLMRGEAIWFTMGTVKWDRAYPDPENQSVMSNAGWSIPLAVYIEKYSKYGVQWIEDDGHTDKIPPIEWVDQCVSVTPDMDGRTVTLFKSPTGTTKLDELWYQGGMGDNSLQSAFGTVNSSVAGSPLPSSEFATAAYFAFTFTHFHAFAEFYLGQNIATWYPSILYKLRVYYLELGQFTYVQEQEEIPEWDPRGWLKVFTPFGGFWDGVFDVLGMLNPFAVFGPYAGLVAFLFTLFIIGIIVLVLLAIFAPWTIPKIFSGFGSAGRSFRESYKGKNGNGSKKSSSRAWGPGNPLYDWKQRQERE